MADSIAPPDPMDIALAAYREALLRNVTRPELAQLATNIDPEIAAWMELMGNEQQATTPDPAFVADLAAQLAAPSVAAPGPQEAPPEALRVWRSHGVPPPPPGAPSPPPHTPRWSALRPVLASLATVMLLLVLGFGFMVLRLRIAEVPDTEPKVPALIRALDGLPGVIDVPLVETTFTPTAVPTGEKDGLYYQIILPPAARLPSLGAPFCGCRHEMIASGIGVEVVQSGRYSVQLEAPLRVQRASDPDSFEEVAAGTEVTLAAGDVAIYPDYAASGIVRNAGEEPVTVVGFAIVAEKGSGIAVPMLPAGVQANLWKGVPPAEWATLPPGPLALTLHEVTLMPGTNIDAYQPGGLQAIRIESGMITRTLIRKGDTLPTGPPLVQTKGSTISSVLPGTGLSETLENTGNSPATLLVLIVEQAESGT